MKQIFHSYRTKTAKIVLCVYAIWFAVNLFAFSFGLSHPNKGWDWYEVPFGNNTPHYYEYDNTTAFYPFGSNSLGTYDVSEFVTYTIAIPVIVFALYRIYKLATNHSK